MRKRLRDAIYLKDNTQGGGKQRRKLKVSERLAQQLEICERTIHDAQNCYEELKTLKLQPESKYCTGFANYQPLPAIPVDISSSAVLKQNYLPIPMLPDASASLLSSPIEHAPILECNSGIPMDEVGNLAVKGRFDMQYKQSPQLPCQGVALAEASQVFVSFLQRLTQHGVVLQLPTTPDFVKETLIGCRAGITQVPGLMGLNEADTAETSPLNFYRGEVTEESKELEPEKTSLAKYSRDKEFALEAKVVACSQMNVFEESKEADPEKSLLLEVSQEKVADKLYAVTETEEELKVVEADERQDEDEFLVPGGGGKVVSESDIEDDDGLKHLWNAMDFSLACMNEIENSRVEADNNKNDGCIHDFYKRDDMGLVCSKCGLIGQDAEYIFNFVWGEVILLCFLLFSSLVSILGLDSIEF
ncbi:hypothetical protein L7F22_041586 [Adiantum nelumboides]|nr:hypothetical protein [Adiantum nelumboides]